MRIATSIGCLRSSPCILVYPDESPNRICAAALTSSVFHTPVGPPRNIAQSAPSRLSANIPVRSVSIIACFASFCPAIWSSKSCMSHSTSTLRAHVRRVVMSVVSPELDHIA